MESSYESKAMKEKTAMVYADPNVRYISSGVVFDIKKFKPVKNREVFNDFNFPPTKPIGGGFWGSTYTPDEAFRSDWERFINKRLYLRPEWMDKIKMPSTVFSLKESAVILQLNELSDVYIEDEVYPDGSATIKVPHLILRKVRIGNSSLIDYQNHFYIDFERQSQICAALFLSKRFVSRVDWILTEFERRVLENSKNGEAPPDEAIYSDELTKLDLQIAEMFEDWNAESLLVMQPEYIDTIGVLDETQCPRMLYTGCD